MNFCLRAARRIVTSPGPSIRQRPGSAGHLCLAAALARRDCALASTAAPFGISIAVGRRRAQSAPILIAPEALGRRGSALAAAAPLFGRLGFLFGLDRLRGSIVTGGFDLFGRWRRGSARSNGGLFVASATAARHDRTSRHWDDWVYSGQSGRALGTNGGAEALLSVNGGALGWGNG